MLDGVTFKASILWLVYKRSKAMTYAMETLYKNNGLFNNTLKCWKMQQQI